VHVYLNKDNGQNNNNYYIIDNSAIVHISHRTEYKPKRYPINAICTIMQFYNRPNKTRSFTSLIISFYVNDLRPIQTATKIEPSNSSNSICCCGEDFKIVVTVDLTIMQFTVRYTVGQKTCHFIFGYNSCVS